MKSGKISGVLGILLACALGADKLPATQSAEASPEQQVNALVDRGFQALQAGQPAAAIEHLADARALALKNQLGTSAIFRQAEYGLGVAHMMLGRYDRTRVYFDRSLSKPASRDQIYNLGAFDLRTRKDVVRSLKYLSDYLLIHDDGDEPMVSLFGACLDRAVEDHVSMDQKRMTDYAQLYLGRKKKVEATQPSKVLWGANWLTTDEFQRIQKKNSKTSTEIGLIEPSLRGAQADYNRAVQRQLAEATRNQSLATGETAEMQSARQAAERYQAQINEFRAQLIQPDFPKQMPAMIPPWKELQPRLAGDIPVVAIAGVSSLDRSELTSNSAGAGMFDDAVNSSAQDSATASAGAASNNPSTPPAGATRSSNIAGGRSSLNSTPGTTTLKPAPGKSVPVKPAPVKPVAVASRDIELNPPAVRAPKEAITIQRTAAAVPVAPDLLLTSLSIAKDAQHLNVDSDTVNREVTVEKIDEASGLALLRVKGAHFAYFNLAKTFTGGPVQAIGYPSVSIFLPEVQAINGTSTAPGPGDWRVSLQMHPRLAGTPVLTPNRELVGIVIATRDDDKSALPTASLVRLAPLIGPYVAAPCGNSQTASVQQVTSEIKVGGE